MTDDYEPVTASDLKPGDEVEVVFRGEVRELGCTSVRIKTTTGDLVYLNGANAIRRKSRPIGVGDRVANQFGDSGEVLAINAEVGMAWVRWSSHANHSLSPLSDLTRVTP
jgi:hypothetical protein